MMGTRDKLNAIEWDAFSRKWKRFVVWRRGERHKIKTVFSRRHRHKLKMALKADAEHPNP